MERCISDTNYIEYLGTPLRQRQYYKWRDRMLPRIEAIGSSFKLNGFEKTMADFGLSRRDAVLLTRLKYLNADEITPELVTLEKEMPL